MLRNLASCLIVQVYRQTQMSDREFIEDKMSTDIPVTLQPSQFSTDPVQCAVLDKLVHMFVRSQNSESKVYWNYFGSGNGSNCTKPNPLSITWKTIGSNSDYLKFDPFVVINTFVERLEVFAVFSTGYVRHTWQEDRTSFADKWDKLGGFSSRKYNSVPVVHEMSHDFFNGQLQLFVRGEDNDMCHIKQTTCDKVHNPWGPCTWDIGFSSLGGTVPANRSRANPLTVGSNIHKGIEVE